MRRILAVAVEPGPDPVLLGDVVGSGAVTNLRPYIAGLVGGLHHLGRTSFVIDYAGCRPNELEKVVKKVVEETKPHLIFAMSTSAVRAAMSVSESIPIVFPSISNPVADSAVGGKSLAVPKRNATGVSAMRTQTAPDCLELFKLTVPSLREVFALHKPNYDPATRAIQSLEEAAKRANVTFTPVLVDPQKDIASQLSSGIKGGPGGAAGILVLPDDLMLGAASMIIKWAHERGLPTFFPVTDWVKEDSPSALGGFGVPQRACGEAAAPYVEKILWRGASPGDLPVKFAGGFEWAVNSEVARDLGIKIPANVYQAVDRVI